MPSLQASAVAIEGRALLIEGAPGSGKSGLALSLIDRGAVLIGDDSLTIEVVGSQLMVRPHPNTRGLIEVRNLGLLTMPVCEAAPAALVITLCRDAPRYIERPGQHELLGIRLPSIALDRDGGNLAIKAELALRTYAPAP